MEKSASGDTKTIKEMKIVETTAANETEIKNSVGRGRPKTKPSSKLASFHLPLGLIAKIDTEAAKVSAGNKSQFIITLLEDYFNHR